MSDRTLDLLQRWHSGDRTALQDLLAEVLPWLRRAIGPSLTPSLRRLEDSEDLAHSAVVRFLKSGPRFVPSSHAQFCALMKRIAVNEVVDRVRRDRGGVEPDARSRQAYGDSVLDLSGAAASSMLPERIVAKEEERAWVRLALEFLPEEDRRLCHAREVEGMDWTSIAARFGFPTPQAARMRCTRALPRLANIIRKVQAGRLEELASRTAPLECGDGVQG